MMENNSTNEPKKQLAMAVNLSKPEHQGTGRVKVTDYLVTTLFSKADSLVRRTFDDFEWIQQRLVDERAGIIVPMLPEQKSTKKAGEREDKFSEAFVQERQELLDRFLQRVICHDELVDAPSLLPFFTANPTDWKAAKDKVKQQQQQQQQSNNISAEASNHSSSVHDDNINDDGDYSNTVIIDAQQSPQQQERKKGLLGRWISAKKDQWALRNKNLVLEETPSQAKKFQDMQEYASHLETYIRILSENCKELIVSQKGQASKFQTMGAAFTQLWGEHELSNTSSSNMYQAIGNCWATISKNVTDQHVFVSRHLDVSFEELILDVVALQRVLVKRKATVYAYTKKVKEGRKMQFTMDKLKAVNDLSLHSDQYYQLERDMRSSDAQVEAAKQLCELVTSRLERDIERFRIEWHERMRHVLEEHHNAQVKFLQEQAKQWLKVLPTLSEIDYSRAALPRAPKKVARPQLKVEYSTTGVKATFHDGNNDNNDTTAMTTATTTIAPVDAANVPVAPAPAASPPPIPPAQSFDSITLEEPSSPPPTAPSEAPPLAPSDSTESASSAIVTHV